jgi:DNA-directed RNA polymerase subunit RPC12/RpoP
MRPEGAVPAHAVPVSRLVLVGCACAVGSRVLAAAAIPTVVVTVLWLERAWEPLYLALLSGVVLLGAAEAIIAAQQRCPSCGARFLIESARPPRVETARRAPLGHFATTVIDVLRTRRFVCMYCGQRCDVGDGPA